jgi:hypothetical protein
MRNGGVDTDHQIEPVDQRRSVVEFFELRGPVANVEPRRRRARLQPGLVLLQ